MTQPTPSSPFPAPWPTGPRTTFPAAQTLTIVADLCGHLPGDAHNGECDYWRGVALGDYPHPDAYVVTDVAVLPPHAAGLLPLTDPALRAVA